MFDLKKTIQEYGIENCLFYIGMQPVHDCLGFVKYTSSEDEYVIVPAIIDEETYKVKAGHKITLKSILPEFGYHHFYISDLESIIKGGHAKLVKMTKYNCLNCVHCTRDKIAYFNDVRGNIPVQTYLCNVRKERDHSHYKRWCPDFKKENYTQFIDEVYKCQEPLNHGNGISSVKTLLEYVIKDDIDRARAVYINEGDKISNYEYINNLICEKLKIKPRYERIE